MLDGTSAAAVTPEMALSAIDPAAQAIHAGTLALVMQPLSDALVAVVTPEGAVDYVLKPVTAERMEKVVERLRARLGTPPSDLGALLAFLGRGEQSLTSYLPDAEPEIGRAHV